MSSLYALVFSSVKWGHHSTNLKCKISVELHSQSLGNGLRRAQIVSLQMWAAAEVAVPPVATHRSAPAHSKGLTAWWFPNKGFKTLGLENRLLRPCTHDGHPPPPPQSASFGALPSTALFAHLPHAGLIDHL